MSRDLLGAHHCGGASTIHLRGASSNYTLKVSQRPPTRVTCSRSLLGARQPWPARPSPARPLEVLGFEEFLSELIARARMLRPHLGSRLFSAPLTFRVHCCTLSGEERWGHMIANPVKSTCTSTTPQLSEHAGADTRLQSLHSKIIPSKLAAGAVL